MSVTVRRAQRAEMPALGTALGRAFADDPIWSWVYPQSQPSARLARMFGALLRVTAERGATVLTDDAQRGVAIWQRSDQRSMGVLGNLRMGAAMVAGGAEMRRGQAVLTTMERAHPAEPHWYLMVLGSDPEHQGRGVGSALMHHVLDDPAHADDAAYLETETEGNVSYYERHGFRTIRELDVPRGGPHLWLMWRDPSGAS